MKDVKLFIWAGFCPDYTQGLAFAIAETETQARELIIEEYGYEPYEWGDLEIRDINISVARCVSGGG